MFISQPRPQRPDVDGNPGREVYKRSACDRCRGQKLRCIRNNSRNTACDRCDRAKAICVTTPMLRMGRSARGEAARRRDSLTKMQGTTSSLSSAPASSTPTPSPPQTASNIDHDVPRVGDEELNASSSMSGEDYVSGLYHGAVDLDGTFFGEDGFSSLGSSSSFEDACDFASSQTHLDLPQFDLSQASHALGNMWHTVPDIDVQNVESNYGELSNSSPTVMASTKPASDTDMLSLHKQPDAYHESVEQLGKLSMEIYRQLRPTTSTIDPPLASDQNGTGRQYPIAMMIHGLQRFQELLGKILSSHNRLCTNASQNIVPVSFESGHVTPATPRPSERLDAPPLTTSPTESRSSELPLPARVMRRPSDKRSSSSQTLPGSHTEIRQAQIKQLDLPTTLLIITCYINVVRLCRNVFSNIRFRLVNLDHQAVFAALSDLQISGVSLQEDGNLQILVLVQVVLRLLDRIGSALCFPNGAGMSGVQRGEEALWDKMMAPKLMDFVLREEELDRQDLYSGGVKALREEIRKLKRLIHKM